jgi:hypothetical protein
MVRTPGSVTTPAKHWSQKQPVQEGIVRGEDGDTDDDVDEHAEDDFAVGCYSPDIGGAADDPRLDGSTNGRGAGDSMATTPLFSWLGVPRVGPANKKTDGPPPQICYIIYYICDLQAIDTYQVQCIELGPPNHARAC